MEEAQAHLRLDKESLFKAQAQKIRLVSPLNRSNIGLWKKTKASKPTIDLLARV